MAKTKKQRRAAASIELCADIRLDDLESAFDLISLISSEDLLDVFVERGLSESNKIETRDDLLVVMERKGVPPEVIDQVRAWVESATSATV